VLRFFLLEHQKLQVSSKKRREVLDCMFRPDCDPAGASFAKTLCSQHTKYEHKQRLLFANALVLRLNAAHVASRSTNPSNTQDKFKLFGDYSLKDYSSGTFVDSVCAAFFRSVDLQRDDRHAGASMAF
jgi:hypothetical protein